MRTKFLLACSLMVLATSAVAQSAIDACNITPTQLRGSARFVGMGGAFTSLGSDLSCMTQNPAGLGLYRHSDIGFTFDISIRNYSNKTDIRKYSDNETLMRFDNFGYVGVVNLDGAMRNFQWGVSYNRIASVDRLTTGYNRPTDTSLSNYIAWYTNGIDSYDLLCDNSYDPYLDSNNDWLSILAFNSHMFSNPGSNQEEYTGLHNSSTDGDAFYSVRERGYTDEYNIDFAGNVNDIVFWGVGVGIYDVSYTREANYSESMANATVFNTATGTLGMGNAGFNLYNWQSISGTGANLKLGLIIRPVEMLRIGLAVHTPTWLHLSHNTYGQTTYYNYTPYFDNPDQMTLSGTEATPDNYYDSKLNTPWRFMIGASVVLGPKAIVSLDYERVAYNDMKLKEQRYYNNGGYYGGGYVDNEYANEDVKNYFRAANIIRIGVEYRLCRNWSVRAGYNYQSSNVRKEAADGLMHISTAGTDPSYSFDNDTHNICVGLGYRYKAWYIDMAYQHTCQNGTFHAFTPFTDGNTTYRSPYASRTDSYNNIVVSTGFKF